MSTLCPTEHAAQQCLCANTITREWPRRAHLGQAGDDSKKGLAGLGRKSVDSDGQLRFQGNESSATCSSRTLTLTLTHFRKTQTKGDPSTGDWERRRQHRSRGFLRALPKPVSVALTKHLAREPAHACPCPYTQAERASQSTSTVLSVIPLAVQQQIPRKRA